MGIFDAKSPAPRANAGDRADFILNETPFTTASPEAEANFIALYLFRRYRLSPLLAKAVAGLAGPGGVFE